MLLFFMLCYCSQGGVVLVSHDERLIRMICKELWVVKDGTVKSLDGGFDEYRNIVEKELAENGIWWPPQASLYNFLLCSCENFYKIWVSSDWWLWFCTGDTGELSISWDQAVYGLRLCIVCDNLDVFSAVEAGSSSCVCSRHIMAGKHQVYKL